jgi:hypothetical protein
LRSTKVYKRLVEVETKGSSRFHDVFLRPSDPDKNSNAITSGSRDSTLGFARLSVR